MHWVVDRSLGRRNTLGQGGEAGYEGLIIALERSETPYTLVRPKPMTDILIPPDWDTFRKEEPPHITLDIDGPVFVTGTTTMMAISRKHGWTPGYVDGIAQDELIRQWGEHVLNHDAVFGRFDSIVPPAEIFFARPVEDTKSFSGQVYSAQEWEEWRNSVVGLQTSSANIQPEDIVMLAPLKHIYAEYRLYVIGGQIVTGSRYKLGSRVFYTQDLDPAMLDYARERIREYCPREAMCLDIAHIEGGAPYRVIETNAISSAGFYACDMNIFVNAINSVLG